MILKTPENSLLNDCFCQTSFPEGYFAFFDDNWLNLRPQMSPFGRWEASATSKSNQCRSLYIDEGQKRDLHDEKKLQTPRMWHQRTYCSCSNWRRRHFCWVSMLTDVAEKAELLPICSRWTLFSCQNSVQEFYFCVTFQSFYRTRPANSRNSDLRKFRKHKKSRCLPWE